MKILPKHKNHTIPTVTEDVNKYCFIMAPTLSAYKCAIEVKQASDEAAKQHQASLSVASDLPIPTSTPSSPPVMDAQEISSDSDHESQQTCRKKSQVHTAVTDDENPASTKEVPQPMSSLPIETVQGALNHHYNEQASLQCARSAY
ncbi:hypothetical protein F5148DRAFT_1280729 [Russula earlei]|uniref:Uncharacterized protein n=1 Tax=Russula earlei TaxID=71964 RepID=A0ACC0UIR9_9AGAM|nr:hypothetical protein F5148DRAFT_1280729 [Russula earlei]